VEMDVINSDILMLDATVEPSNIEYPNDVKLMNVAREWICKIILDVKNKIDPKRKIRTYRRKARILFLDFQKKKRKTKKTIYQSKKKMASYLNRNITQLSELIFEYEEKITDIFEYAWVDGIKKKLQIAQEIIDQQTEMIQEKTSQVANRIVSFHQPQVRPIVRGKEGRRVEFGPKVAIASVDGFAFLDKLSFNNFNEGIRLEESLENHKDRFGKYPKMVLADDIYSNRYNRQLLKEKGIEHSFKNIGKATKEAIRRTRKLRKMRNQVEGTIGTLKEHWSLKKIIYTANDTEFVQNYLSMGCMNIFKAVRT